MEMDRVEDLWIEVDISKNIENLPKPSPEKYVIGNIYRHPVPGSQYKLFCEKLCNILETLNKSKTKSETIILTC